MQQKITFQSEVSVIVILEFTPFKVATLSAYLKLIILKVSAGYLL